MYSLQATGIPLPRIFGTVTIKQRPGIVMERLAGTDQFSLLERKPWLFWTAAKKLAQLHAQIHSMVAPEQLQSLNPSIRREMSLQIPCLTKANTSPWPRSIIFLMVLLFVTGISILGM
jgi:hypothetical protein